MWFRSSCAFWGALLYSSLAIVVHGAPLEDLVEFVPGYGRPPTTQFSGFLNATEGCDTSVNGNFCYLHYWLAMADMGDTAEEEDVDAPPPPVILWLNGGPGSSSILGWLTELGPLLMNATGGLMENPYSWTKAPAHVLALEAPVGVGYSYCERQVKENKPCQNTDRYTASASRAAMVDFFSTKFPEFQSSDFYITGESYAGVYIPTLAQEILTHNAKVEQQEKEAAAAAGETAKPTMALQAKVPLKGIAVGDPCTDNTAQADSMDDLWYGHKYGLVDDDIYEVLWNQCNVRAPNLLARHGGLHMVIATLNTQLKEIEEDDEVDTDGSDRRSPGFGGRRQKALELFEELMNYDNNRPTFQTNRRLQQGQQGDTVVGADDDDHTDDDADDSIPNDDTCLLAYRKFLLSSSKGLSQSWRDMYIDDYSFFAPIDNSEDEFMAAFMMSGAVQKALHVETSPSKTWPFASQGFHYAKEYDACNWGDDIIISKSMIDIYREIVPLLDRTWVYNGDTDPCVSYEGTRTAVKRVGLNELDGGGYRPWFYNQTATSVQVLVEKPPLFGPNLLLQNMGSQYAGHVVNYEQGLAFVTIHGSGHMVPQFRPQAALHFLQMFLNSKGDKTKDPNGGAALLAPLIATNSTLTELPNDKFSELLDAWTQLAKTEAYVNTERKTPPMKKSKTAEGEHSEAIEARVLVGNDSAEESPSTNVYLRG